MKTLSLITTSGTRGERYEVAARLLSITATLGAGRVSSALSASAGVAGLLN